jgi:hypothetical protein
MKEAFPAHEAAVCWVQRVPLHAGFVQDEHTGCNVWGCVIEWREQCKTHLLFCRGTTRCFNT